MFKAGFQAGQELKVLEELPKENQTGEGRESLMFEGESGNRAIVLMTDCELFFMRDGFLF